MYAQIEKPKENKSRAVGHSVAQKKSGVKQGGGFVDNRVYRTAGKPILTKKRGFNYEGEGLQLCKKSKSGKIKKEDESLVKLNEEDNSSIVTDFSYMSDESFDNELIEYEKNKKNKPKGFISDHQIQVVKALRKQIKGNKKKNVNKWELRRNLLENLKEASSKESTVSISKVTFGDETSDSVEKTLATTNSTGPYVKLAKWTGAKYIVRPKNYNELSNTYSKNLPKVLNEQYVNLARPKKNLIPITVKNNKKHLLIHSEDIQEDQRTVNLNEKRKTNPNVEIKKANLYISTPRCEGFCSNYHTNDIELKGSDGVAFWDKIEEPKPIKKIKKN
ncbi:hypothetical protein DMA11_13795 [Marinilabiliaceae bacterium JC017]|nr:hypothetical protein DMA11_13795 [Marinilabiliaceae bacterium JC017]